MNPTLCVYLSINPMVSARLLSFLYIHVSTI